MPIIGGSKLIELEAANINVEGVAVGATANLPTTDLMTFYTVVGSATLTSSLTIQASGDVLPRTLYLILYGANITTAGNALTIFGQAVPAGTAAGQVTLFAAFHNGTAWQVAGLKIKGSSLDQATVTLATLANINPGLLGNNRGGASAVSSLTTAEVWEMLRTVVVAQTGNYGEGTITLAKLANLAANQVMGASGSGATQSIGVPALRGMMGLSRIPVTIPISFSNNGRNDVAIPINGFLERLDYTVQKATVGTATIVPGIATTRGGGKNPIAGPAFTIPGGLAANSVGSWTPTGDNDFTGHNSYLILESSGASEGELLFTAIVVVEGIE